MLNLELLILVCCFTTYFYSYLKYYDLSFLYSFSVYFLSPLIAYFIGLNIYKIPGISIEKIIYSLSLGYFTYGFLNFINTPQVILNSRQIINFWSSDFLTATLQGSFYTLISSLLFYSIFISKKKSIKVLTLLASSFSVYASIQSASRTLLVIFFITFIANILLFTKLKKENFSKKIIAITFLALIALFITISYNNNWLGIQELISSLPISNRTDIQSGLDTPRYEYMIESLKYIFSPFQGGGLITKQLGISYIHNLWLDTVNTVGLVPGAILLIYSVSTLLNILKLIKSNNICLEYKHLFFSLYLSSLMEFFVEPILEGIPYFFATSCLINGLTFFVLKRSHKKNEIIMDMQQKNKKSKLPSQ
ncbi:hypothetical protein BN3662_03350 [Clostridiales bacterium CHKCI006]|nr:hypothetical protein BN3662_03350 [Clostridiales bacterium CHKCI006]